MLTVRRNFIGDRSPCSCLWLLAGIRQILEQNVSHEEEEPEFQTQFQSAEEQITDASVVMIPIRTPWKFIELVANSLAK